MTLEVPHQKGSFQSLNKASFQGCFVPAECQMLTHGICSSDQFQSNRTSIPVLKDVERAFQDNVSSIQDSR